MITLESVSFRYRKKQPVLENLSLSLEPGNTYGLLGLNGAGKSTLLKLLTGLVAPKSGVVSVAGHRPFDRTPAFLRELFLVPEDFQLPACPVVELADRLSWMYPLFEPDRFKSLLKLFAVSENDFLNRLSFGQQKKAFLSFAFAVNTRLLLLDEPTNGLDIPAKEALRRALIEHHREDRIVILSTHQIREIENQISAALILHNHNVICNKSMDRIVTENPGQDFEKWFCAVTAEADASRPARQGGCS